MFGKQVIRLRRVYGRCRAKARRRKRNAILKTWALKRNKTRKGLDQEHFVRMCGWTTAYYNANKPNAAVNLWSVRVNERVKHVGLDHDDTLTCMGYLASVYEYFREWNDALKWRKKIVNIRRNSLGEHDYLTLNSMRHLSDAYRNCHRDRLARKILAQVRNVEREIKRRAELGDLQDTARQFTDLGRFDEAKALVAGVKSELRSTYGPRHPRTLEFTADLATIYQKEGKLNLAAQVGSAVASLMTMVLGKHHRSTLSCSANLASTYEQQGRHSNAAELLLRVVNTARDELGEEDTDTLAYMEDLASMYFNNEQYNKAGMWGKLLLKSRTKVLGEKHPKTILCTVALASTNLNLGRYPNAQDLCFKAMEAAIESFGPDHPVTISHMSNIADIYRISGQHDQAEKQERLVISKRKEQLGISHPDTIESIGNLAKVYKCRGQYEIAELLQREIFIIQTDSLGKDHSDTLSATVDLAITYYQQGRLDEAVRMVNDVLRSIKSVDVKRVKVLNRIGNLVVILLESHDLHFARRLGKLVVEAKKRVLGLNHEDTLISMANLAMAYVFTGQFKKAEELMEGVVSHRAQTEGGDEVSALISSFNFGIIQLGRSWYVAREISRQVASSLREILGDEHPHIATCIRYLKELDVFVEKLPKTCRDQKRKRGRK